MDEKNATVKFVDGTIRETTIIKETQSYLNTTFGIFSKRDGIWRWVVDENVTASVE